MKRGVTPVFFFFSRNTPPTILQALRRQCLRHLCELLRVQFSCAPIYLVAWSVRAMAWWGHVKKRKPRSCTRLAVDGREPCAGWWWQLIQNVQEMSYSDKKLKVKKWTKKALHLIIAERLKVAKNRPSSIPFIATSFLLPVHVHGVRTVVLATSASVTQAWGDEAQGILKYLMSSPEKVKPQNSETVLLPTPKY